MTKVYSSVYQGRFTSGAGGVSSARDDGTCRSDAPSRRRPLALQVFIVVDENLSDEGPISVFEAEEVDMRRPVRMATLGAQDVAARTVGGHRISGRLDRPEVEPTPSSVRKRPRKFMLAWSGSWFS